MGKQKTRAFSSIVVTCGLSIVALAGQACGDPSTTPRDAEHAEPDATAPATDAAASSDASGAIDGAAPIDGAAIDSPAGDPDGAIPVTKGLVWTNRYDNDRSGANTAETSLTTANVQSPKFGLLFSRTLDGIAQAQPLYVPGLTIKGSKRNVVFVATEHDSVYAFDADDPTATDPLWRVSLGPAAPASKAVYGCADLSPEVGVTSTPVIDASTGTIYVVAKTMDAGAYHHRLHALDITTGAARHAPVEITATVSGTGNGSVGGKLTFSPDKQLNRVGLLLHQGAIYVAFGSHCDAKPAHGWVMAYDAASLAQRAAYVTTPNGSLGCIWQAGIGLSADASGVYFAAGNGDFDAQGKGAQRGQSVARMTLGGAGLTVADWWTPAAAGTMNGADQDLSTAPILGAGTRYVFVGAKDAHLYVLDRTQLGGLHTGGDQIVQTIPLSGHLHGGPVFWNGPAGASIFLWAEGGPLRAYRVGANGLDPTPTSSNGVATPTHPGGMVTLSSNGTQPGTGIVWVALAPTGDAWHGLVPGALYAFDAADVSKQLFSSDARPADALGTFAKFSPPVVANGKVFVGTASNALRIYGLHP
jgi:hypothetical protein